jgi:putative ABC transport system substrate-binding protein
MNRRDAILAVAALGLAPLPGRAQPAGLRRIGILGISNLEPALGYLREGLRELGYIEGKTLQIEPRSAADNPAALPAVAAELVALKPDVIVAFLTPVVQAAMKATSTIPIVMGSAGDPVATGLIKSLARPGGNVTGVANTTAPLAGKLLGIAVQHTSVRVPVEYDAAFAKWASAKLDAVVLQPSLPRARATELALKHKLLTVSPNRDFVDAGALLAYAVNTRDRSRAVAVYVDKILKGAKPADLPVEQPTRYELVVNLKTAKALGVKIPQSVLVRADQVLE